MTWFFLTSAAPTRPELYLAQSQAGAASTHLPSFFFAGLLHLSQNQFGPRGLGLYYLLALATDAMGKWAMKNIYEVSRYTVK